MKRKYFAYAAGIIAALVLVCSIAPISAHAVPWPEKWMGTVEEVEDYDYSFAILGDIQSINYMDPASLEVLYDYVVENVQAKKIAHVFGLGDITEKDSAAEWERAQKNIKKLDGVVPYSLVRGNHDTARGFNAYFGLDSTYADQCTGFYGNNYLNMWQTFRAGELDYLVLTLDYGAEDAVLEWAGYVVENHPNHNVIVTTHSYLNAENALSDETDSFNAGTQIWDKFIRKYENIVMVISGHVPSEGIQVSEMVGDHGNSVKHILVDPQSIDGGAYETEGAALGMVAMFYFSDNGRTITTQYYSTVYDRYWKENGELTFTVNTISDENFDANEKFEEADTSIEIGPDASVETDPDTSVETNPDASVETDPDTGGEVEPAPTGDFVGYLIPAMLTSASALSLLVSVRGRKKRNHTS